MAEAGWVLWYWGATFKGRGEYVRLVFEAAGVPYTENNDGADIMSHCDMQGHKGKGYVSLSTVLQIPLFTASAWWLSFKGECAHVSLFSYGQLPSCKEAHSAS